MEKLLTITIRVCWNLTKLRMLLTVAMDYQRKMGFLLGFAIRNKFYMIISQFTIIYFFTHQSKKLKPQKKRLRTSQKK